MSKNIITSLVIAGISLLSIFPELASAQVLDLLGDATKDEVLSGDWRIYFVGAALTFCGVGFAFSMLTIRWVVGIIVGSFMIAAAEPLTRGLFSLFS
jgi:hypothetical protein